MTLLVTRGTGTSPVEYKPLGTETIKFDIIEGNLVIYRHNEYTYLSIAAHAKGTWETVKYV